MTKEQAIAILENVKYELSNQVASKHCRAKYEATEMAIKSLEQQPSDDCVSRKELLKLYGNRAFELQKTHQTEKQLGINWCINTLNELPPVTPTHHKSATNGEEIIRAFPNLKYTIQNGRVVTTIGVASSFDLDWWNAPYKGV